MDDDVAIADIGTGRSYRLAVEFPVGDVAHGVVYYK
jgi:hypothetical protein